MSWTARRGRYTITHITAAWFRGVILCVLTTRHLPAQTADSWPRYLAHLSVAVCLSVFFTSQQASSCYLCDPEVHEDEDWLSGKVISAVSEVCLRLRGGWIMQERFSVNSSKCFRFMINQDGRICIGIKGKNRTVNWHFPRICMFNIHTKCMHV